MTKERNDASTEEVREVKRAIGSYLRSIGSEQSGYILFMVLFVLFVVSLVGIMLIVVGTSEVNVASRSQMMEQAYTVAEAGVNRAVVQMTADSSIAGTKQGQYGDDPEGPETLQWSGSGTLGEKRQGLNGYGEYVVSIHYDTRNPTETASQGLGDSFYKLVISTGKYTWAGKSVERTIEAKIYIPAGYQDVYDQAFDYCIFNGLNQRNDELGNWPSGENSNDFTTFPTGKFTLDGATPYVVDPSDPASISYPPKGALYTRGNISLEFESGLGTPRGRDILLVRGNVVATNNLTIKSAGSHYTDIDFNRYLVGDTKKTPTGNLIAGIDGTGDATVTTGTGHSSDLKIWGAVCAGQNVTINGTSYSRFNILGGLIAGGNVLLNRDSGRYDKTLTVGPILSCGSTVVNNVISGTTKIDSITAGKDGGPTELKDTSNKTLLRSKNLGVALVSGDHPVMVKGESPYNAKDANGKPIEHFSIISSGEVVGISLKEQLVLGDIGRGRGIKAGCGQNDKFPEGYVPYPDASQSQLNYGVWLWFQRDRCTIGNIQSYGRVNIEDYMPNPQVGRASITAGTDGGVTNPVGVFWRLAGTKGLGGNKGKVSSNRGIVVDAEHGCNISMGELWSGGSIKLTTGSIKVAKFDAVGNITVTSVKGLTCPSKTGTISAGGLVTIIGNEDVNTSTILSNSDVTLTSAVHLDINGAIKAMGNVSFTSAAGSSTDTVATGIWGRDVTVTRNSGKGSGGIKIGAIPGYEPDSIRATGTVTLNAAANQQISVGFIQTGSPPLITPWPGTVKWTGKPTQPPPWSEARLPDPISVNTPDLPAAPPAPVSGHGINPDDSLPYEVDLLGKAGLDLPVRLPEPNWWHFLAAAASDDLAPEPNLPHILLDGGPKEVTGDQDGSKNGVIEFLWQPSTDEPGSEGYSDNETVYQDDPNVTVEVVVKDWGNFKHNTLQFRGTLVSKGPVKIDASGAKWGPNPLPNKPAKIVNVMNVISGSDITFTDVGSINNVKCLAFHLYAGKNIVFQRGEIRGDTQFYGSFTAGNKVVFNTERLFERCIFKWSRWEIDPAGWIPEFKVLSWREV